MAGGTDVKSEEMSETEVQNFLKANGGGKEREKVADKAWKAPGLSAWYFYDTTGAVDSWMWVATDEAQDKVAAYEAAEQTRNQQGF
jgi:hypothetical protein